MLLTLVRLMPIIIFRTVIIPDLVFCYMYESDSA